MKKKRVTEEQKNILLDYTESNTKPAIGKFTADFSYADSCKKREELKNILNALRHLCHAVPSRSRMRETFD